MPKWTNEQLKAINESGKNIIVSAGAGSGKTAVLTQRVITKLKSGTNIQNLLILTFTNAAALEMKSRIRKAVSNMPELSSQLDLIDSAYITTFDSFSMSIVKKYHYLLNVSNKVNIIDKNICDNIRNMFLDDIFEEEYKSFDNNFINMIKELTIKDDISIKKGILNINTKLDRLINKEEYLDNYIDNYYSDENINKLVLEYDDYINGFILNMRKLVNEFYDYCDEKYYNKFILSCNKLINSKGYDEIKSNLDVSFERLPNGSSDEVKKAKEKITEVRDELKKIMIYRDSDHVKNTLLSTKKYVMVIIDIIKKLDSKLFYYKSSNDVYEFNDIAKMAIKVVRDNDDVRSEIRDSFEEIMVDEYQDTSDIQEAFINLIENDNVYMVGDVKQSIYRFRNANPLIFRNKYINYSNFNGGIKIDLLNNFRSRKEVLCDINNIFDYIMDIDIGGADYIGSHRMVSGNKVYDENHPDCNYELEIYNYSRDNKKYSYGEYEAFLIANDIKNKVSSGYKVYDGDIGGVRDVLYKDFCILIDRKTDFDLYKKIFEYLSVPLKVFYDERITREKDLLIIKNIIDLIIKIYNKNYDKRFEYDFYSIFRSYLYNRSDDEFLDIFNNKKYFDDDIFVKCKSIADELDLLCSRNVIDKIISLFNFYDKVISVGDIDNFIVRIDFIKSLADNLSNLGYSIFDFSNYLEELVLNDSDISISEEVRECDSVKLMNIHKSKGLEFPVCYFAGFSKSFNRDDIKENINFDDKYGFIVPFYDDGCGNTIAKKLYENKYVLEDVSERIRLLYVALTRAKEKMIIVADISEDENEFNDEVRRGYRSFLDIIFSIKDKLNSKIVNIDKINVNKEYNMFKDIKFNISSEEIISDVRNMDMFYEKIHRNNVSKRVNKLLTSEEVDKMNYGSYVHRTLELSDFNDSTNKIVNKLVSKLDINGAKVYKEYEFITRINNEEYHGIVDLMLEYDDVVKIVDYKLKNIDDEDYIRQLSLYKEYVYNITNKDVKIYLYSIIDDVLKEIIV